MFVYQRVSKWNSPSSPPSVVIGSLWLHSGNCSRPKFHRAVPLAGIMAGLFWDFQHEGSEPWSCEMFGTWGTSQGNFVDLVTLMRIFYGKYPVELGPDFPRVLAVERSRKFCERSSLKDPACQRITKDPKIHKGKLSRYIRRIPSTYQSQDGVDRLLPTSNRSIRLLEQ